ncbi:MAG: hypothetical protein HOV79_15990 [Hamadaea sp.]|nr:hypothetical protein [Hamadaea sp.]
MGLKRSPRRSTILVVTALTSAFFLAGCTSDRTGGASATASATAGAGTTATVSAVPTDVPGNTRAVCVAVRQIVTDGAALFTREITEALQATSSGAGAGDAAVREVKDLLTRWASDLRKQAAVAVDPALKAALTTEADAFERTAARIVTRDDLVAAAGLLASSDVTQAGTVIRQACTAYWAG